MKSTQPAVVAALTVIFASLPVLFGCGGKKTAATPPGPAASPSSPIWKLAPADAVAGVVIRDGSLTVAKSWLDEFMRIADARPESKQMSDALREEMASEAPVNPLDSASIAAAGIDLAKGAALFVNAVDDVSMVLPISDRKAFASTFGGASISEGGVEIESFDGGKMRCKLYESHYVCASSADRLAMFGASPTGKLAEHARGLAPKYQGDVQILVDAQGYNLATKLEGIDRYLSQGGVLAIALKMESGRFRVDGVLPGLLAEEGKKLASAPNQLAGSVASARPSGFFRARLDPSMVPIPSGMSAQGLDISELLRTLTGEAIGFSHAGLSGSASIRVGIKSADSFKQLLSMGCEAAAAFVPGLRSTLEGSSCNGAFDLKMAPPEVSSIFTSPQVDFSMAVESDRLDAKFSMGGAGPVTSAPTPSKLGADLLSGNWNLSMWGEGASPIYLFDLINTDALKKAMGARDEFSAAIWLIGHLYEAGFGIGFREDGLHMVLDVTSFSAAGNAELVAYEALLSKAIDGDAKGAQATLKDLATKQPEGILGRQIALRSGSWIGTAIAGVAGAWMTFGAKVQEVPDASSVTAP